MSDYRGPERRGEMWDTVCKDRFHDLKVDVEKVEEEMKYVISKIDNGLSDIPKRMSWLMVLFGSLIIAVVSGFGIWTWQLGKLEGALNNHIETTSENIEQILREVEK